MAREYCVDEFPKFAGTPTALDSAPNFIRRSGMNAWDHVNDALIIYLDKIEGKPACVLKLVTKRFTKDSWAAFAVPVFGATWDSDQTIVDKGIAHEGDDFTQHIVVRYPTHQQFKFDADKRSDGLWEYTITLLAK